MQELLGQCKAPFCNRKKERLSKVHWALLFRSLPQGDKNP